MMKQLDKSPLWKFYKADILSCATWLSRVATLGLTCWAFFYFLSPNEKQNFPLFPSNKQPLLIHLSGELTFNENSLITIQNAGQYRFKGQLKARPTPLATGTLLHMRWRQLLIYDHENRLVIAFIEDNGAIRYRSDPFWTDEERDAIYQAFSVDITNTDPSADQSHFRQPFKFYVTHLGGISEINLPRLLKVALRSSLDNLAVAPFIEQAIDHPENIPPLLSAKSNLDTWNTEGAILSPLKMHYRKKSQFGHLLHVQGQSERISSKQSPLSSESKAWFAHQQKDLLAENLKVRWEYDLNARLLKSLDIDFSGQMEGHLLNSESLYQYQLKASAQFELEKQKPAIAEVRV
ncbi:hypothetical protein SCG7109_AC_00210 [Chlamydiales bacterium SCGC AG-110-M15]|nr:hypothetical protein SCG7109_AC_00210 [Chlamydiales bacterium SCGC AG-110-M15]